MTTHLQLTNISTFQDPAELPWTSYLQTSRSNTLEVVSMSFDNREDLVGYAVFVFRRSRPVNQSVMSGQSDCQIVEEFCPA